MEFNIEKFYKKVFGGKCGYQVLKKKSEYAQLGATGTLWEINKFATTGRTQIYVAEKYMEEDLPYMQLEIYKSDGIPGWSIEDDEIAYYFYIGQKHSYQVRSCWLFLLAERIKDFIDDNENVQKWMSSIKRSGSKNIKFVADFGVPSLPTEIEMELKCERSNNSLKVLANIDWKQCMNKLKMDIEKIKL